MNHGASRLWRGKTGSREVTSAEGQQTQCARSRENDASAGEEEVCITGVTGSDEVCSDALGGWARDGPMRWFAV